MTFYSRREGKAQETQDVKKCYKSGKAEFVRFTRPFSSYRRSKPLLAEGTLTTELREILGPVEQLASCIESARVAACMSCHLGWMT